MVINDPRLLAQIAAGTRPPMIGGGAPGAGVVAPAQVLPTIAAPSYGAAGPQYVQNLPYGQLPAAPIVSGPVATAAPADLGGLTGPSLSPYQRLRNLGGGATSDLEGASSGLLGGVASSAPSEASKLGGIAGFPEADYATNGAGRLLSRLASGGPGGALKAFTAGDGPGLLEGGLGATLGRAAGGAGGVAIPAIGLNVLGNAIGGKAGQVTSDTGTGLGVGGALGGAFGGALAAALPFEIAAGPVGWGLAGLGAAAGGIYGLLHNGDDGKSNVHQAYSTGWKKIDQSANAWGIQDDNLISGEKRLYNSILQNSKDPTDKATQKQALAQVEQDFGTIAQSQSDQKYQTQGTLALQAYGQQALAPLAAQSSQSGDLASAVFDQIAKTSPNAADANVAHLGGAIFKANSDQANLANANAALGAPLAAQQQASLIAQFQQQLQAKQLAAQQQTAGV